MLSRFLVILALAGSSIVLAQDDTPAPGSQPDPVAIGLLAAPKPVIPPGVPYAPLTLGQNYEYTFGRVFSPGKLLLFGLKAGFDEERRFPRKWDDNLAGYGERYADHFGRALLRENINFGVRALDGEDPRYELSRDAGFWQRSKHALARAFVTRARNGSLMPAYSRFVADFATPFIAEQWEPGRVDVNRALRNGAGGIGFAVCTNLATEFWPDIRHRFLRK